MPRPNVIKEDARMYNLLIPQRVYDVLQQEAFDLSKQSGRMVSVAHLIREALEIYVDETHLRR